MRQQVKTAMTLQSFSPNNVSSFVVMATGGTNSQTLFGAIRIRRVKIWVPPVAAAIETVSFEWTNLTSTIVSSGPPIPMNSSAMGSSNPSVLTFRPPKGSRADMWLNTGDTVVLFTMSCPVNSLVELDLQCVLDVANQTVQNVTTTGTTIGDYFQIGLDGLTSASSKFTTLGVPSQG